MSIYDEVLFLDKPKSREAYTAIRKRLAFILENQAKINPQDITIPEPKPLSDKRTCEFCQHYQWLKNKYRGCEVWNLRNYGTKFSCEFQTPIMIDGLQQVMLGLIREIYPRIDFKNAEPRSYHL